jgi:hypothetical protein
LVSTADEEAKKIISTERHADLVRRQLNEAEIDHFTSELERLKMDYYAFELKHQEMETSVRNYRMFWGLLKLWAFVSSALLVHGTIFASTSLFL